MSLIRVGLSETRDFAEGYDAIFGRKADKEGEAPPALIVPPSASVSVPEKPEEPVENPFRTGPGIGC